eukprot:Hpha_TRINITY_DN10589_c0_g1::TRINITY_DN10589_c0_g1_i1::g.31511::m.31511
MEAVSQCSTGGGDAARRVAAALALPSPSSLQKGQLRRVHDYVRRVAGARSELAEEWKAQLSQKSPRPPVFRPRSRPVGGAPSSGRSLVLCLRGKRDETRPVLCPSQPEPHASPALIAAPDRSEEQDAVFSGLVKPLGEVCRDEGAARDVYLTRVLGVNDGPRPEPEPRTQVAFVRRRHQGPLTVTTVRSTPFPPPPPADPAPQQRRQQTRSNTPLTSRSGLPLPRRSRPLSARPRRASGRGEVFEEIDLPPPPHGDLRGGVVYSYDTSRSDWERRDVVCTLDPAPRRQYAFLRRCEYQFEVMEDGVPACRPPVASRVDYEGAEEERGSVFVDVAVYTVAARYASEWEAVCPGGSVTFTEVSVLDLPHGPTIHAGTAAGLPEPDTERGRCLRLDFPDPLYAKEVKRGCVDMLMGRREGDSYSFESRWREGGHHQAAKTCWSSLSGGQEGCRQREQFLADRMDAFTHFTFCESRQQLLVIVNKFCNDTVLEVCMCLSDSASSSVLSTAPGGHWSSTLHTSRGISGRRRMARWLRYHRCNPFCRLARLPAVPFYPDVVLRQPVGVSPSSPEASPDEFQTPDEEEL